MRSPGSPGVPFRASFVTGVRLSRDRGWLPASSACDETFKSLPSLLLPITIPIPHPSKSFFSTVPPSSPRHETPRTLISFTAPSCGRRRRRPWPFLPGLLLCAVANTSSGIFLSSARRQEIFKALIIFNNMKASYLSVALSRLLFVAGRQLLVQHEQVWLSC